jgi:hypothetical protein
MNEDPEAEKKIEKDADFTTAQAKTEKTTETK